MTSPHRFHTGRGSKGSAHRSSLRRGKQDNLGLREHGNHPSRERWKARSTIHIDPMANRPKPKR
jgi:hypothetical protein